MVRRAGRGEDLGKAAAVVASASVAELLEDREFWKVLAASGRGPRVAKGKRFSTAGSTRRRHTRSDKGDDVAGDPDLQRLADLKAFVGGDRGKP